MNKFIFTILLLVSSFSYTIYAQDLEQLKKQRDAVKYKLEIIDKKIDIENAKFDKFKKENIANDLKNSAKSRSKNVNSFDLVSKNTEESKEASKAIKKYESANKSLEKSIDKIIDLEADIKKLEYKLDESIYRVDVVIKPQ